MTDLPTPHVHPRESENQRARAFDEEIALERWQAAHEKQFAFVRFLIAAKRLTDEVSDG